MSLLHSKDSVEIMMVLPLMTKNIGELMSQQQAIEKRENRDALPYIIRSIKFLFSQELALRGGYNESLFVKE